MEKATLLSDDSLKKFIAELKIKPEDKEFLFEKVPLLNLDQRKSLLRTLFQIYLLELEEAEVIKRIKKFRGK